MKQSALLRSYDRPTSRPTDRSTDNRGNREVSLPISNICKHLVIIKYDMFAGCFFYNKTRDTLYAGHQLEEHIFRLGAQLNEMVSTVLCNIDLESKA